MSRFRLLFMVLLYVPLKGIWNVATKGKTHVAAEAGMAPLTTSFVQRRLPILWHLSAPSLLCKQDNYYILGYIIGISPRYYIWYSSISSLALSNG